MSNSPYRIVLAKEDFKFSSAHFTVFGPEDAEPLHGHNYRVEVELSGSKLDSLGLLVDLARVKGVIRARCDELDSLTLVPEGNRFLELSNDHGNLEVRYADRLYCLPENEVLVLPLANVTIEELARMFWEDLRARFDSSQELVGRIDGLTVKVQETDGQSCVYSAPLD